MTRITLLGLLLFLPPFLPDGFSQEKIVLFLNSEWNITIQEHASFYREAEYDANNFKLNGKVMDYALPNRLIMEGYYTAGKRNGEFVFYSDQGQVLTRGQYVQNNRAGRWEYFYENGNLKQLVLFPYDGKGTDFSVIEFYDIKGGQSIKNGTGKWVLDSVCTGLFDQQSPKRLTGEFKDSLKHGDWKLTRLSDNKLMHTETFKKGRFLGATIFTPDLNDYGTIGSEMMIKFPDQNLKKLVSTEAFKLDTTVFSKELIYSDVETIFKTVTGRDFKILNRTAGYAHGDNSLLDFINQNIRYPADAMDGKISGRVYVNLIIDSLGLTKEVYILRGVHTLLDKEAIRVVQLVKDWLPALKDGKAVESTITIPVRFEIMQ